MDDGSRLFIRGVLDLKEEIETKLECCYKGLDPDLPNVPTEKLYEILNVKVCKNQQDHEDTMFGLLYVILTDKTLASKAFHLLTLLSQDSMGLIIRELEMIIMEKMQFMKESPRIQIVWLTRELIALNVVDAERLCFALLKQTPCGDTSERNIIVIEHLLHLLLDFRSWVESQPALIGSVVYTYLSLIPDHMSASFSSLRDEEVSLCASLLHGKFCDCMLIGRDLVRLLQNVARIPQFTDIWKDLIFNPQSLYPQFNGLEELLCIHTPRRFIAGRLTSDMETKLNFLTSKVKFGLHKRYQLWFQLKYFSTPESQSLVVDIIRYLCCVVHPTNEILCSDVVPRWLLIGWLLSLCTYGVISANAKLALFFDWPFYNKETDNIMNVEPGILVMYHSLRTYPHITSTLLEFICSLQYQYCSELTLLCNKGIKSVIEDVTAKQVIPSFDSFIESSCLDENLKQQLSALLSTTDASVKGDSVNIVDDANMDVEITSIEVKENMDVIDLGDQTSIKDEGIISEISEATSTDFDDLVDGEVLMKLKSLHMPDNLKKAALSLCGESNRTTKAILLNDTLDIVSKVDITDEVFIVLIKVLSTLFKNDLLECYDKGSDSSIENPVTCILCHALSSEVVLRMIPSFQEIQSMMGTYLLQYLIDSNKSLIFYKKLCKSAGLLLHDYLYADMKICVENDPSMFFELIPKLYHEFSTDLIGSVEFLNIVVGNIDPQQLCNLICKLLKKEFYIFGSENVYKVIMASLEWDTFEQICVWQLLNGEEPSFLSVASLLPDVHKKDHPEAFTNILLYIKRAIPEQALLSMVLQLPSELHNDCVSALLNHWAFFCPGKLGDAFSCHSSLQTTLTSHPSTEYILNQLTNILQISDQMSYKILNDKIQKTLNELFAEDPTLAERFGYIRKLLKSKAVKFERKPVEDTSSDEDMPVIKRRKIHV